MRVLVSYIFSFLQSETIKYQSKRTITLPLYCFISVPAEFLWSEWGLPDKLCDVGTQKRTTMCGSLRRRLPNKVGRDSDDPAGSLRILKRFFFHIFHVVKQFDSYPQCSFL